MLYSSSIAWSFRQSEKNTRKFFIKTLTFIPLCVFKNIICPFWAVLTDRPSDRPIDRHLGSWRNTSKIVSIRMTTIISYLLIQDHTSQDHFCSVIDEFMKNFTGGSITTFLIFQNQNTKVFKISKGGTLT